MTGVVGYQELEELPQTTAAASTILSESFVGGRKEGFSGIQEGYAPLQGDFVEACLDSGTQDGKPVPGVAPVGNFLVENRRTQTEASSQTEIHATTN